VGDLKSTLAYFYLKGPPKGSPTARAADCDGLGVVDYRGRPRKHGSEGLIVRSEFIIRREFTINRAKASPFKAERDPEMGFFADRD
jgi:hypothetical protein